MSNVARVLGAGGNTQGITLSVEDVFSTTLYKGNASTQTITNGIDLSGEGGLVWAKNRTSSSAQHALFDTENGTLKALASSSTAALATEASVTSFNSNGFSLGNFNNNSGEDYVSWTFRKAEKFFDIQTWTGNGASDRAISHNLGSVPGMIIVKRTVGGGEDWAVWHRDIHANTTKVLYLNKTDALSTSTHIFGATNPTSTDFYVGDHPCSNNNGDSYVAYLFAHNDGDAEFGADGNADIIKCGNYSAVSAGTEISLGFEPQFIVIKKSSAAESWYVYDSMRGVVTAGGNSQDKKLRWNTANPEAAVPSPIIAFSANGFILESTDNEINGSGGTYIYMAIRRGDMATPTTATDVFAIDNQSASSAPFLTSNFPVDMVLRKDTAGGNTEIMTRLTQNNGLIVNSTGAEQTDTVAQFDFSDGCLSGTSQDTSRYGWMWKRARGYFDVVAYTGTGSAQTISHNLGVAPEMMWVKARSASGEMWFVYHKDLNVNGDNAPETDYLWLNGTHAAGDDADAWNDTAPTASAFSVKSGGGTNGSGVTYIAFLFATVPGVSKLGGITGNGSTSGDDQDIDCGFTSGARFVLIKRTSGAGGWYFFDSTRGIVAGNDPFLNLTTTAAENTGVDLIEPLSSGFTFKYNVDWSFNLSGNSYIFYAIA